MKVTHITGIVLASVAFLCTLRLSAKEALPADLDGWTARAMKEFNVPGLSIAAAYVTFSLNPDGSITEMRLTPVSAEADFSADYQDLLFRPVRTP